MRKLATIRKIAEIKPIPDADRIVAYRVDGWWVVDSVGKYQIGDLVIYAEVDSWIPHTLAPFLSKGNEPREFENVKGERLRTIRLKGQLSQGLLLPLNQADKEYFGEGEDVTEDFGILKWEAPIPAELSGDVKGSFPGMIPKTDQLRIQNLDLTELKSVARTWEITEKIEGTSATFALINSEFNVCSRNWNIKQTETNTYWVVAQRENLEQKLKLFGYDNIAIQAEVTGPNIQGNIYKLSKHQMFVFDVYDINTGKFFSPKMRIDLCKKLGLTHAPIIEHKLLDDQTLDSLLTYADGFSQLNPKVLREGVVFKSECGMDHFKVISNKYLLKTNG